MMTHPVDTRLLPVARWLTILAFPLMLLGPAPMEVGISLVALLFLARSAIARDWAWLSHSWVRLLLALWLWSLFSSLFAEQMEKALIRSAVWIRYVLLAPALACWVLPDARTERRMWFALLGLCLFLMGDAWLQYATGTDLFGHAARVSGDRVRLTGPFSNPRVGITLVWLAFPVLCLWFGGHNGKRLAALGFALGLVLTAFLSGERMAFLLCALGLGLCFLLAPRARLPLCIAGMLAAIALGLLMQARPALKDRQVGESSQEIAGFWQSSYGQLWLSSLRMVEYHPVLGVGPKNFRSACPDPRYGPMGEYELLLRCTLHPHNIYMEWLAETGLVGFALFLALIGEWLRLAWQHRRMLLGNGLLAGLMVALLIRLWPLSATTSQFAGWSAVPFWLLTGWLLAHLLRPRPEPGA